MPSQRPALAAALLLAVPLPALAAAPTPPGPAPDGSASECGLYLVNCGTVSLGADGPLNCVVLGNTKTCQVFFSGSVQAHGWVVPGSFHGEIVGPCTDVAGALWLAGGASRSVACWLYVSAFLNQCTHVTGRLVATYSAGGPVGPLETTAPVSVCW